MSNMNVIRGGDAITVQQTGLTDAQFQTLMKRLDSYVVIIGFCLFGAFIIAAELEA
ncbi:MAG: hypothetical protein NWF07_16020 [Candidatus Bathyarchaeota archaeon]|nr:hypothetical protein [Candidatus Bathyarchaeota archaeon]